ncbi:MAG: fused MFS/spermidine synthase, partial [Acetobacteraceae bacterium]|nr:fused MFS/spermidine synthase [Acetobacteraceae bacterium]
MPRLMLAFFCSGFAALLCQIVWQRMLGIFAGSDTISAALVVGAFLAGLGLGSILGAKVADRLSPARALLWFAACEAGVALCALLSKPFLYDWLALGMAGRVDSPVAIFALCFAGLVLPTTLMGASLPLLSRAIATSLDTVAERIALLYGLNTLGAGLGALVGGWLLVGNLGFVGALVVAAGLNLAAAGLALTLMPAMRGAAPPPATPAVGLRAAEARFGGLPLWCLLVFLSGYVIVALEIVWVRLLGQVGQYHAYLFPTLLGVFLLADGIGMAAAARMVRRMADPRPAFFITQGAGFVLAVVLIGTLWLALPYPPLSDILAVDDWRFTLAPMLVSTTLIVLVVAPPAFLIGMTFPFVQRAVQQDLASVGARVGWVQLANIAGNAAGSIGTGLLTLHLLGTMGTLVLLAAVSLALLLFWLWREGRGRRPEMALAAACAAAVLVLPSNDSFWRRMHGQAPGSFAAWAEDRSGVAFYREVPDDPEHERYRFFIMGHSQGMVPFLPVHVLLGAIGPLVHPNPERVLAIGVGSSGTPWGAVISPQTREVRAIELIKPVLDTLRGIAVARPEGPVAALLNDPRVRFEYGDGRRALARDPARYDVIEADAVLPQTSHSGLLYSAEFLEQVRGRLARGGVYVQWAPTARVVETFVSVFPYAVLLQPFPVLIGSNDPIP